MDFKLIIKGLVVGIGKVIPGVSGSMLAMVLGIYEKLINAITNFFDNIKDNSHLLINFGLGLFIAIILFSKFILFLLEEYYLETIYLFLGLIIGTFIPFIKQVKFKKKNIIIGILSLILVLSLSLNKGGLVFIFEGKISHYLYTIFLGFIDALTSIVPGISGTAIYMLLGSYEYVLSILSKPISLIFILYILGVIGGIIIVSFIMNYLFKNWKEEVYSGIFGLMLGSLILLLLMVIKEINLFLLLFLGLGFILGLVFKIK